MSQRTIFLDRDGVINKIVFRDGKPGSPRHLDEFDLETGVDALLSRLRAAGYKLFVVTNQPDVARGVLGAKTLQIMTDRILEKLLVDGVRICPHDDRDTCDCRKPRPGMLVKLAQEYDLDLRESYLIGDSRKDTLAAERAGCRSIILDRSYNQGVAADRRVADLAEAVDVILAETTHEY
jgi:D-glycero-D-manno-heptose 1,7-bisphosphate phosphatase